MAGVYVPQELGIDAGGQGIIVEGVWKGTGDVLWAGGNMLVLHGCRSVVAAQWSRRP